MKILLVTHYYPAHGGGVEIVAGQIASHLIKREDVEIVWAASDIDPIPDVENRLSFLPMKTLNITEENLGIPYPLWSIKSLRRLQNIVKDCDIVHLHEYFYMGNLLAFCFAKIYKKAIVITQHIGFIPYRNPLVRNLLKIYNFFIGRLTLSQTDTIIFYSETTAKYFRRFVSFKNKPQFISNGVDINIFKPLLEENRISARKELALEKNDIVFLFVGRFVEKKGLFILRELAMRFSAVNWLFVGWGLLNPEVWNLPNVKVFWKLPPQKVTNFYQVADLLVLPSRGEGFPLVVQESMACGTPVLVGKETAQAYSAAMPFIFFEDVSGKDVIDRWIAKIDSILQNPKQMTELRPKVVEFTMQHWNWQRCEDEYYKIFRRFLIIWSDYVKYRSLCS